MLKSNPDSGISRTRSQWNVFKSAGEYAVTKWRWSGSRSTPRPSSRESISTLSSGNTPAECQRVWDCDKSDADAEDVESCCWSGDGASTGERYENDEFEPWLEVERTDMGDVGARACIVR